MLESKIDPDKKNTVRVQANELKRISLHKCDNEEELRSEWKKERQYYEGPGCQRLYIPCKVFCKVQPFQPLHMNYHSGKSMRSVMDEGADLSIYPQMGF